jgi:hypothetical protein
MAADREGSAIRMDQKIVPWSNTSQAIDPFDRAKPFG